MDVEGLTDVASGKATVLTYTTEFFDPTEYTPSYVKTVTADGIEKYIIYETTATTENLQKIAYALPSEVTVITENGRKAQVPVTTEPMLGRRDLIPARRKNLMARCRRIIIYIIYRLIRQAIPENIFLFIIIRMIHVLMYLLI